MYQRTLALLVLVLAACGGGQNADVFADPPPIQQQVTDPQWTVVLELKQEKPLTDPFVRIYVVVNARQEGEAAIIAHNYVADKMRDEKCLRYMEAALKK